LFFDELDFLSLPFLEGLLSVSVSHVGFLLSQKDGIRWSIAHIVCPTGKQFECKCGNVLNNSCIGIQKKSAQKIMGRIFVRHLHISPLPRSGGAVSPRRKKHILP
jgi:hypothetical protein